MFNVRVSLWPQVYFFQIKFNKHTIYIIAFYFYLKQMRKYIKISIFWSILLRLCVEKDSLQRIWKEINAVITFFFL